jgi:RNA polymerase sigma factor (sigma-70 family)
MGTGSGTLMTVRDQSSTGQGGMDVDGDVALLVKRAANGEQAAWDAIVARYNSFLWSVARGYRLDRADAADAVQVAWLRLVEHLPRLRDPERLGAWLATTVRRECLLALKSRGRRGQPVDDVVLAGVPDAGPPVDNALIAKETASELWQAFEQLQPRCQTLLRVLMADPAPSYQDVSAALEMPVGSIGPTRARCLDRLRTMLDDSLGAPS